jgi:TetR/AcrR family transcriptional repressor of nem operon
MNIKHDKENVLKIGLNLFCKKGYNALGIDEICKITGMTKGAFYNAFKSKEQFLIESILLYGENNVKRIQTELLADNQYAAFEILQRFYIKMLEAQPRIDYIGCFINNMMSELGIANELVGKLTTIEFNKFIDAIEPTVKKAQEEGDMIKEINARKLTELLHATFYGALTIAKSSQDFQQSINTIKILFNSLKLNKNG